MKTGLSVEEAERRVRQELAAEGFGLLTQIDVQATLKDKLGVERPPYKILGVCNSPLAHEALASDEYVGLLLPCNLVVFDDGEGAVVAAIDPQVMLRLSSGEALSDVADAARSALTAALGRLEARITES